MRALRRRLRGVVSIAGSARVTYGRRLLRTRHRHKQVEARRRIGYGDGGALVQRNWALPFTLLISLFSFGYDGSFGSISRILMESNNAQNPDPTRLEQASPVGNSTSHLYGRRPSNVDKPARGTTAGHPCRRRSAPNTRFSFDGPTDAPVIGAESRMKESYRKGVANHPDPESCGVDRKGGAEALTGARAGEVLSREINQTLGADAVVGRGRQHRAGR